MNIKVLNAHLRLLGPAPVGMKWRMVKNGETLESGDMRTDTSDTDYKCETCEVGRTVQIKKGVLVGDSFPNARYWRLAPAPSRPWRADPLDIARSTLPVEELRRETVDGIIADFIKTASDEKTFRAYLRAAKKGLTEADYD